MLIETQLAHIGYCTYAASVFCDISDRQWHVILVYPATGIVSNFITQAVLVLLLVKGGSSRRAGLFHHDSKWPMAIPITATSVTVSSVIVLGVFCGFRLVS